MPLPDASTLALYMISAMVLLLTPGPAVLYIVARSIDQGRLAGVVSALGIGVGSLFHITAAAVGVSAVLAASALAFSAVKYLGAAYLVFLGIRRLFFETTDTRAQAAPQPRRLSQVFVHGVVVNVLNPKTALFFFAFLPQFIDPARGPAAIQIFLLGAIFVTMAICSDSTYALFSGTFGNWLRNSPTFLRGQKYITGSRYVALGIGAALAGPTNK